MQKRTYGRPMKDPKRIGLWERGKELVWVTDGDKGLEVWRTPGGTYSIIEPITSLTLLKNLKREDEAKEKADMMEGLEIDGDFVKLYTKEGVKFDNWGVSPPSPDWYVGMKPKKKLGWKVVAMSPLDDPWYGYNHEYPEGHRYAVLEKPGGSRFELCMIEPVTKMMVDSVSKSELERIVAFWDPRIELPRRLLYSEEDHQIAFGRLIPDEQLQERFEKYGPTMTEEISFPLKEEFGVKVDRLGKIHGVPSGWTLSEGWPTVSETSSPISEESLSETKEEWEERRKKFILGGPPILDEEFQEEVGLPPIRRR